MMRLCLLTPALFLVACAPTPPAETPVLGAGECRNEPLAQFAGQQASQQLGADMLRVSGARHLQWINPDQMVTMEFRSDRVRANLDASGRVESARCG